MLSVAVCVRNVMNGAGILFAYRCVNVMHVFRNVLLALFCSAACAQLSDPVARDHQIKSHKNKFLKRTATQDVNQFHR